MASFNKFNQFVQDIGRAVLNLNTDTLRDLLTNTSPNAADTLVDTTTTPCTVKATSNATELAAGNGYTKKGTAIGSTAYSQTSGTATLSGGNVVYTASGGTVGPFRYVVCYDDTSGTTATRSVIGWWDYGSSVSGKLIVNRISGMVDGTTYIIRCVALTTLGYTLVGEWLLVVKKAHQ